MSLPIQARHLVNTWCGFVICSRANRSNALINLKIYLSTCRSYWSFAWLGISLQSGLKFQGIDENHLSLTCDRANGRQRDRGGNAPIGNEREIVERLIDGFNGVVASRLDSVELRERKRAQESYRCKCCSFWQRLLSSLGVLFKGQSDHYTHIWGRSTLGSVRLLRME